MQLTQMIVGCTINLWAYDYLKAVNPSACHISPINIKLSIAMYFSYFVLFARFFYVTYLSPNARKGKQAFNNGVQQQRQSSMHMSADDMHTPPTKLQRSTISNNTSRNETIVNNKLKKQ